MLRDGIAPHLGRRRARERSRPLVEAAKRAHEALQEVEERELLERALEEDPSSTGTLKRLATHLQIRGESERAEELWRRLAVLRPDRVEPRLEGARLRLAAGDLDGARTLAEEGLRLVPAEGTPYGPRHVLESLVRHLRAPPRERRRHVVIGGASFCGSTLVSHLLGAFPGVANVGESHTLLARRVGHRPQWIAPEADAPEVVPQCVRCGSACPVLTPALRRQLRDDPTWWWDQLARAYGVPRIVSSDKNPRTVRALDPMGMFDLLVLFKHPVAAWNSTRRKPASPWTRDSYLRRWDECYRRLHGDLRVQGRRLFLHFDRFRTDPEGYLRRVAELLGLEPFRGLPDPERDSIHCMGGNSRAHDSVLASPRLAVDRSDPQALSEEDRRAVDAYAQRSSIYAAMLREHERVFEA